MNWQVVKDPVAYGREQEKLHDKHFRFTVTTNGVLLNDEIQDFVNKEMDNVVLSLDGRKEVNDRMRPFRNGKGSYDRSFRNSRSLQTAGIRNGIMCVELSQETIWTSPMMCFILRILDSKQMSIEPVVGPETIHMRFVKKIFPVIMEEYDKLAKIMIEREKEGKGFEFLPLYDRLRRWTLRGKTLVRLWLWHRISGGDTLG